jgi:hypothetical protein
MNDSDVRLVLHDVPIFNFVLGFLFAGVGGFALYQGGPLITLLFIAVGLGFLLLSSVLTVTADRVTRVLTLEYRSALRYSRKELHFNEIAGIGVQAVRGSKGGTNYRVVVKRNDDQLVPFRSSSSTGSGGKERLASRLRNFTGIPEFDSSPAGMTYAALASYTERMQETEGVHWIVQPVGCARWYSPDFKSPGLFLCLAQKAEGQATGGFLASVGGVIYKQVLSRQFRPDDIPGLDHAVALSPLDPMLEPHFIAYTNNPDAVGPMLDPKVAMLLADWAARYPVRQLKETPVLGPLTILFSPNGVYLAPMKPLQSDLVGELTALGTALVKSRQ